MWKVSGGVVFVSTPNADPWSAAEELWAQTAVKLMSLGVTVSASVTEFPSPHPRIRELQQCGAAIWFRPDWYSLQRHPWRRLRSRGQGPVLHEVERLLAAAHPALVVLSDGDGLPPIGLLELCAARRIPFVTLAHSNKDAIWYRDDLARRYRAAVASAERCFFVSGSNLRLSEKQLGHVYDNAEVVFNPVNMPADISLAWPPLDRGTELRLACVGRLWPTAKGQDILFEALAAPAWQERQWKLYLYGNGDMRQVLETLAARLGIADRVVFAGFASVPDIWSMNHVLVVPSRYEGVPLTVVEAMLCARPVVATDVGATRDMIDDGITGFLADSPTAAGISQALERFWERRDEAERMGKAASDRIRRHIPADAVQAFSDKLQSILQSTRTTH